MLHRCQDYKAKDEKQVTKFMPRYDGPYMVTQTVPEVSTITVDMPNNPKMFPTFHTSQVLPFKENDPELFPAWELEKPDPVMLEGKDEYYIEHILEERKRGRGMQYLVC
ncbi:hypothetical protein L208DRAFT_1523759 [Tricholoma matsutake]|nr:hypothetical protein L208DRAFT_1523759 [Tricholoma matsutake 945]